MNRRKFFQDGFIGFAGLSGVVTSLSHADGSRSFPATDSGASLKSHWPVQGSSSFYDALENGAGFSFRYGGQEEALPAQPEWHVSTSSGVNPTETLFRHRSGLTAARWIRAYPAFDAVEYTITFKNDSTSTLPALGPIYAMDLTFGQEALFGAYVVSSGGGLADSTYPPKAYAISNHWIGPMTPISGEITLTTKGGRSSNKDLPFYFVQNDATNEGVFMAIGWTGQWGSTILGNFQDHVLHITGGIPNLHIRLRPGETVRGPSILIGCYRGPISSGSNRLRKLIRSHYTPDLEGKPFEPITTYDSWWNIGVNFDQNLLERTADTAARIGQEYFLLDAGWYVGANGPEGFSGGVGNWEEVDRTKFPSGLDSFANYVRSKGLKFGLWFEPERVAKGTLLAKRHPDWILWLPPHANQNRDFVNPDYGLLDYGRAEVREWVRNMLDGYIRKLGIRYIRHDFNMNPLPYWDGNDAKDRMGISQIRHIEGFYEVIDWIRNHHPATVLECCSSGGRRIDLETARRFHTFWISDQTADPDLVRFHLEGINHFLPGSYSYVCYTLPLPNQAHFRPANFAFQSFFGGAFGTGGRVDKWPRGMKEQALDHVNVYKKIRRFLVKDYYLLAPEPRGLYAWEAWQFHDPGADEGFVQVFHVKSTEPSRHFVLKALDPHTFYRFSDPYSGKVFQATGASVISEGLEFQIPQMASQILIYERVGEAA